MKTKKTLRGDEITTDRKAALGRRSALTLLGAGVVGSVAWVSGPSKAAASSDSDPTDPAGRGRTGFTDRDSGPSADGAGRGVCPERGWSDSDPSDPAGRGRGPCH